MRKEDLLNLPLPEFIQLEEQVNLTVSQVFAYADAGQCFTLGKMVPIDFCGQRFTVQYEFQPSQCEQGHVSLALRVVVGIDGQWAEDTSVEVTKETAMGTVAYLFFECVEKLANLYPSVAAVFAAIKAKQEEEELTAILLPLPSDGSRYL